jgi:hypothetical protein
MRSDAEPPEHGDWFESGSAIDVACSGQARAEHFQQCAEFPLLCNRGLGALAVTVLPVPFARRPAATASSSLDHLVGAGEQRHFEAERIGFF